MAGFVTKIGRKTTGTLPIVMAAESSQKQKKGDGAGEGRGRSWGRVTLEWTA